MNGAPSTLVSPGLLGFAAFFFLAIALWLLMRNMNARMRRMSYAARRRQEELEQRVRGADAERDGPSETDAHGDGAGDGGPESEVDDATDDHEPGAPDDDGEEFTDRGGSAVRKPRGGLERH